MNDIDILFPGFVTLYKDTNNFIHLYFFPGIDKYNKNIYMDLNLSNTNIQYKKYKYNDGAIEYIFNSKHIVKITCKLVSKYNDIEELTLYVN